VTMKDQQMARSSYLALAVIVLAGSASGVHRKAIVPLGRGVGPDGWTVFAQNAETLIVHVSSSAGSDANDGLSPARPFKTLAKGMAALRNGHPDWLLLKRGDVWFESLGTLQAAGPSAQDPIRIGSYGEEGDRPLLMLGDHKRGLSIVGRGASNIAVTGIHFYDHKGDPASEHFVKDRAKGNLGIWYFGLGENILVEDCRFQMLSGVVGLGRIWVPKGKPTPKWGMRNFQVRRCVVHGAWTTRGHCQGCFFNEVHGLLLEEDVLDHNGWNDETGDLATVFNHNVYITIACNNVVARSNIVTRGSTTGLYCRTNGILVGNLCVDNCPALNLGRITKFRPGGVTGRVSGNVVFGAPTRKGHKGRLLTNHGIEVGNVNHEGVVVEDNIVVGTHGAAGIALKISPCGVGVHNATFRNNIVFDWPRTLNWVGVPGKELAKHQLSGILFENNRFQVQCPVDGDPAFLRGRDMANTVGFTFRGNTHYYERADDKCIELMGRRLSLREWIGAARPGGDRIEKVEFVDPSRNVATYHRSLGKEATLGAFLQEAYKQSRHNWREAYTARAVIQYIREGFRLKADPSRSGRRERQ